MVPYQQGQNEGRREEVATNPVWSIHHFGEDWKQCLSSRFANIYANVLRSECGELKYQPPLIMDTEEVGTIPTVDDFAPKYLDELPDRRTRTS